MLIDKVKRTIKRHSLLSPGDKVVVAVSGGPDSVCLLSVLHELSQEIGLSLHVAHLDHRFRGKQSADEAAFVAEFARKMGIPSTIEAVDVPAYCRDRGLSSQAGAREVRYAYLDRVARSLSANRIATGHTASDQAETFLLRLLRGAGMSGLSAIPPVRGNIIRPLIDVTREEIEEYLRQRRLPSVSDPSNEKPVYARNRVRLELLPVLKQFNPRIVETLAAEADLLRDDDAALQAAEDREAAGVIERSDDGPVLLRDRFNALPPAFRRRLLQRAVEGVGAPSSGLSHVQTEEAVRFLETARTGRALRLPFGLEFRREYDRFLLRRSSERFSFSLALTVPGTAAVPQLAVEVETAIVPAGGGATEARFPASEGRETAIYFWQAQFDYDKITPPLVVRNRRPGDRICPSGMGGRSKKLQDLFTDGKIPRGKRDRIPLLASGDDILWAVGIRTDERYLPGTRTKQLLVVTVRPLDDRQRTQT